MIDQCDAIYVLSGYEESVGTKKELEYVKSKGWSKALITSSLIISNQYLYILTFFILFVITAITVCMLQIIHLASMSIICLLGKIGVVLIQLLEKSL